MYKLGDDKMNEIDDIDGYVIRTLKFNLRYTHNLNRNLYVYDLQFLHDSSGWWFCIFNQMFKDNDIIESKEQIWLYERWTMFLIRHMVNRTYFEDNWYHRRADELLNRFKQYLIDRHSYVLDMDTKNVNINDLTEYVTLLFGNLWEQMFELQKLEYIEYITERDGLNLYNIENTFDVIDILVDYNFANYIIVTETFDLQQQGALDGNVYTYAG